MSFPVRRPGAAVLLLPACAVLAATSPARAQQRDSGAAATPASAATRELLTAERYVRPPAEIERLVLAPRRTNVTLSAESQSPDRRWFFDLQTRALPTVHSFGRPHHYLAGLQVDPRANRARALTTRGADAIVLVDAGTGRRRTVPAPEGATVSSPVWSPTSRQLAFVANFDDASRLYVVDAAGGRARRVGSAALLATLVTEAAWTADGRGLVAVLVPARRGREPERPAIETGPLVRMTTPEKDRTRTYASLLRDPFDKRLLQYHVTGQLAVVDVGSGAVRRIGAPAMIAGVAPAPDARTFRVTLVQEPFSYKVPHTSFGQADELWDASGRRIATVATRPLRDADPATDAAPGQPDATGGADTARRAFGWMPDGQGLYFLQQEPAPARAGAAAVGAGSGAALAVADADSAGGEGGAPRRKDRLYQWTAPYTAQSRKVLLESDARIAGVLFSDDAKVVFVAENARGTGHVYARYLNEPGKRHTLWRLRGLTARLGGRDDQPDGGRRGGTGDDSLTFYQNPGDVVARAGRLGGQVAMLSPDGRSTYLTGIRYTKVWQDSAPRGFVDRVEIRTGRKTRLFEGAADAFESVTAALDDSFGRAVVTRESPTAVPDASARDLRTGQATKLTSNADHTPEFTRMVRKRVAVTRADGTRFLVRLTLPAGYTPGTRLPGMLWFYPYEYTDQAAYDRALRTQNINQFPAAGPRTIEYLATQGYAVANFDPPILGTKGRINDNYVGDLRNDLYAVIEELDRGGYIDRTRLAVGGHSYGAFSTVNAMVHTPFFRAGIAGDGMYNRTLTPNGFQSERRDFWEAQKTYVDMSPFFQADKLTGALLMYHSLEDQNSGTDPISSVRMMHALEALGKTAALYMYPYEDHGPATSETLLDQWARWVAWLDSHVKSPGPKPDGKTVTAAAPEAAPAHTAP